MRVARTPVTKTLGAVTAAGLLLFAAGCASGGNDTGAGTGADTGGSGEPIKVGVITSLSGPLASYGEQYMAGIEAGLEYATDGTGEVNGSPIELVEADAAGDPAKATSAAKDLIGQGITILAGPASSGVAVQLAPLAEQNQVLLVSGPAATDAMTGINELTYRSGRQTYQDVQTAGTIVGDPSGKDVLVFAQDYEFGQANAAAVEGVLGGAGANVDSLLVPLSAKEFTPFAQQINQKAPDLLFVAWAGDTTSAMWQALEQQGVFENTTVVTGLADKASYSAYGSATEKITFLSHYFPEAPDNPVNEEMVRLVEEAGGTPDLFTPDGFVAAQMIVHSIEEAGGAGDVAALQSALDGWTFDAPKGEQTVRAEDHAMIQPMFVAKLTKTDDGYVPELVETVPADQVAPPVATE
jgi:branched-chain amino acid transport system substrate-binding protein